MMTEVRMDAGPRGASCVFRKQGFCPQSHCSLQLLHLCIALLLSDQESYGSVAKSLHYIRDSPCLQLHQLLVRAAHHGACVCVCMLACGVSVSVCVGVD